jgi:hypothetical protein
LTQLDFFDTQLNAVPGGMLSIITIY